MGTKPCAPSTLHLCLSQSPVLNTRTSVLSDFAAWNLALGFLVIIIEMVLLCKQSSNSNWLNNTNMLSHITGSLVIVELGQFSLEVQHLKSMFSLPLLSCPLGLSEVTFIRCSTTAAQRQPSKTPQQLGKEQTPLSGSQERATGTVEDQAPPCRVTWR